MVTPCGGVGLLEASAGVGVRAFEIVAKLLLQRLALCNRVEQVDHARDAGVRILRIGDRHALHHSPHAVQVRDAEGDPIGHRMNGRDACRVVCLHGVTAADAGDVADLDLHGRVRDLIRGEELSVIRHRSVPFGGWSQRRAALDGGTI